MARRASLISLVVAGLMAMTAPAWAQQSPITPAERPAEPTAIPLGTGGVDGSTAPETWFHQWGDTFVRNVTVATLTPVLPGPGKANGAADVDAGRAAKAQSFMLGEIEDMPQRFGVGNAVGKIRFEAFEIGGDTALAYALGNRRSLGLERSMRIVFVEGGAFGVGQSDLDIAVEAMQAEGGAGQRSARADRADEAIDLAVRVVPDLPRRRFDMGLPVGDIVELVCPDRPVRLGLCHLLGEPT